ncbi:MAG: DNA mismatch repair endonuclease MutL [Lentisphaeria bacterium]|nr:DNA mismatch repair endonuclease MutL [Lentisphaeria bacterium]
MSAIHLLTDDISNKIAAGEVIERPASVVKELVENALDAGAKKITVRIERAGTRLIMVSDNGCGMDPDDAVLCFEPHATSKIRTAEDLEKIITFGFRGEAMPSIASVARVTLKTRQAESQEGTCVVINGGNLVSAAPTGCAPGTEMIVKDLFFNVPARRKFLKSQATEERHIIDVITVISLAHPEIAFELFADDRSILMSPACSKLLPRIRDVFGREIADAMVPVNWEAGAFRITGFITKRGVTKPSRSDQRIFVNGRPVDALPVYRGIRDGCGPMLDKGRYHPAVIFIEMPPEFVDVNVHPAKREVRFRNEFELGRNVKAAIESALRAAEEINPFPDVPAAKAEPFHLPEQFLREGTSPDTPVQIPEEHDDLSQLPPSPAQPSRDFLRIMEQCRINYMPLSKGFQQVKTDDLFSGNDDEEVKPVQTEAAKQETSKKFRPEELEVIGVVENTYLIAKMDDGLVLIDQHAAHERILYERILKGVDGMVSQKLLLPLTLELSKADCRFVIQNTELFEKSGFTIEHFGGDTVKIEAIPAALSQDNAGGIFRELLSKVKEEGAWGGGKIDTPAIARAACKAAVKAHDILTPAECKTLLKQMGECELPYCCPHGRPTIIHLSIQEIERRFGRRG